MKRVFIYMAIMLVAVGASSCSVTRNRTFTPSYSVRLDVQPSDVEFLGETEISVEYQTYLGFIRIIDRINGKPYDGKTRNFSKLGGTQFDKTALYTRSLDRAAYKVIEKFPNASYYMVAHQTVERNRMFLSSDVKVKATVRAYRLINRDTHHRHPHHHPHHNND